MDQHLPSNLSSVVESGKATEFFVWLSQTQPTHVTQTLLDNECVDWESLKEVDSEALQYMGIGDATIGEELVRKLAEMETGASGAAMIEAGLAEQFHQWVRDNYPNKNYGDILVGRGYTTRAKLCALDQAGLVQMGIRAFGVQKKLLRQIKALEDQGEAEPGTANGMGMDDDNKARESEAIRRGQQGYGGRQQVRQQRRQQRRGPRPRVGLVLLGETGAGKSTFYQALMDHALSVPFERIRETERNPEMKATESQTKQSERFEGVGRDYVLHIIDTPGIGDTEGVEEDQRHVENITKFLSEDCDFNAICMIIKNGANRATARMQYIVSEIKAHLTRDVWPQVFTIVTRCAANRFPGDDTCAVIDLLGLLGPESDRFFLVDNYAYERVEERRRPRQYLIAKQRAFEEAGEQLERIIQAALVLPMKTGEKIGQLRTHRIQCKEKTRIMQAAIDSLNSQVTALRQAEASLKQSQTQKQLNRNYSGTTTYEETVPKTMPNGGKATVCGVCHQRCHDPCYVTNQGDISSCCAMTGDTCNRCNHGRNSHHHSNTYFVKEQRTKSTLDAAAKARYDSAVTQEQKQQVLKDNLQRKIHRLEREQTQLTQQIADIYVEIDTLAVESFNEYFPKYVEELIADLEGKRMTQEEKNRQIRSLKQQIEIYEAKKRAYMQSAGRSGGRAPRSRPSRGRQRAQPPSQPSSALSWLGF